MQTSDKFWCDILSHSTTHIHLLILITNQTHRLLVYAIITHWHSECCNIHWYEMALIFNFMFMKKCSHIFSYVESIRRRVCVCLCVCMHACIWNNNWISLVLIWCCVYLEINQTEIRYIWKLDISHFNSIPSR